MISGCRIGSAWRQGWSGLCCCCSKRWL